MRPRPTSRLEAAAPDAARRPARRAGAVRGREFVELERETPRVSLSWIMAAFNEEESLEPAATRVLTALEESAHDFELIIVDDGSTDRTGPIADALAERDARVRVLHNERNRNYAFSLLRGIRLARCDWILHDGVDLPLAPEDLGRFTALFDAADVLVARRLDRSAHSPWRKVTSWTNNLLLRLWFAPRAKDLNFVQFYRRSFVQSLELVSTSPAFITPEIILRAERLGVRVREVPIVFQKRGAGRAHFGRPRDILWTMKDMLRFRVHTWRRGWGT